MEYKPSGLGPVSLVLLPSPSFRAFMKGLSVFSKDTALSVWFLLKARHVFSSLTTCNMPKSAQYVLQQMKPVKKPACHFNTCESRLTHSTHFIGISKWKQPYLTYSPPGSVQHLRILTYSKTVVIPKHIFIAYNKWYVFTILITSRRGPGMRIKLHVSKKGVMEAPVEDPGPSWQQRKHRSRGLCAAAP